MTGFVVQGHIYECVIDLFDQKYSKSDVKLKTCMTLKIDFYMK